MLPQFVLEVDSVHDVPLSRGQQFIPDFERPEGALGAAFMKERALLQVCLCEQPNLSSIKHVAPEKSDKWVVGGKGHAYWMVSVMLCMLCFRTMFALAPVSAAESGCNTWFWNARVKGTCFQLHHDAMHAALCIPYCNLSHALQTALPGNTSWACCSSVQAAKPA